MSDRARSIELLQRAARSFRLGMDARGNEALGALVGELMELLADPGSGIATETLAPHLPDLIAAQERRDSLYLADQLEFVLLPLIG